MKTIATIFLILFFCGMVPIVAIAGDDAPKNNPELEFIQVFGCKACHMIHGDGGSLAADLTQIGSRLTAAQIEALLTADTSTRTKGFMPSYSTLSKEELQRISNYLYNLR
ncbi:MAG: c-type cytochrome [Thermodesulfobacteriota bacterium]|nr:c-type cytochrome [Thermodesulfobacteriota bacterium]